VFRSVIVSRQLWAHSTRALIEYSTSDFIPDLFIFNKLAIVFKNELESSREIF